MRATNIDVKDLKKLSKITEIEALKFLQEGRSIIYRSKMREFLNIADKPEFERAKRLYEQKVFDLFELYIR